MMAPPVADQTLNMCAAPSRGADRPPVQGRERPGAQRISEELRHGRVGSRARERPRRHSHHLATEAGSTHVTTAEDTTGNKIAAPCWRCERDGRGEGTLTIRELPGGAGGRPRTARDTTGNVNGHSSSQFLCSQRSGKKMSWCCYCVNS